MLIPAAVHSSAITYRASDCRRIVLVELFEATGHVIRQVMHAIMLNYGERREKLKSHVLFSVRISRQRQTAQALRTRFGVALPTQSRPVDFLSPLHPLREATSSPIL